MPAYVAVAGTHGAKRRGWDDPRGPFAMTLRAAGYVPLRDDEPARFGWSTALDGIDGTHLDWQYAGLGLYHYFVPPLGTGVQAIPPEETNLLVHSHALQVVAYACGRYGLKVNGLISVGSPIRGDLLPLYADAAKNIRKHLHLHARKGDLWQIAGALFDGRWGIHREHPHARNEAVPGGHIGILQDARYHPLWLERGWLRTFDKEQAPCPT